MNKARTGLMAFAALILVGCKPEPMPGPPTLTLQFDAGTLASVFPAGLQQIVGKPRCGVVTYHYEFATVGGAGEATLSSGAIMVPTGPGSQCGQATANAHPVVLYAHGTSIEKRFDLSNFTNGSTNAAADESALIADAYAAQGFIVVAPNYAGYDTSTLSYHPYLNEKQQAQEMMDALDAARAALATLPLPHGEPRHVTDAGSLFIAGYSQGGYVALAALKAMRAAGRPVTAVAPASGPYALGAYVDAAFSGRVPVGGTYFAPLLLSSYQHAYGTLYGRVSDVINGIYAPGFDSLLPLAGNQPDPVLVGRLPAAALFQSAPTGFSLQDTQATPQVDTTGAVINPGGNPALNPYAYGFDPTDYLIASDYRQGYLLDALGHPDGAYPLPSSSAPFPALATGNTLRTALTLNDLRGDYASGTFTPFIPASATSTTPVVMCGGYNDPTVFYPENTAVMAGIWSGAATRTLPVQFAAIDIDSDGALPGTTADPAGNYRSSTAFDPVVGGALRTAARQLQTGFQQAMNAILTAGPGAGDPGQNFLANYHDTEAPFCTRAAQVFFSTMRQRS